MKYTLYHGSDHIIQNPDLVRAKPTNDYGKGFYCTKEPEMAKEWACKNDVDGVSNEYLLEDSGLRCLNLLNGKYSILNWLAILLANRTFVIQNEIENDARDYLLQHFLIDLSVFDIVVGYRADDSYFSFAQSFVSNTLPLRILSKAMTLGNLGKQTALISKRAFDNLAFVRSERINRHIYFPKYQQRDTETRTAWKTDLKKRASYLDDIFAMDILREKLDNEDPRIQRLVSQ